MIFDWNNLIRKVVVLFPVLFILILLYGCSPVNNPGDLSVVAEKSGPVLTGTNNAYVIYSAIYGTEYGHSDRRKSDASYGHLNLLVSLFILMPQDDDWRYIGGGTGDIPWRYSMFYNSVEWLLYPHSYFVKLKNNGTADLASKKKFTWGFDGKNRTITIDENISTISAGEYVIVKLDKHWKPEVWVGESSFDELIISLETRNKILNCYMALQEGVNAKCY